MSDPLEEAARSLIEAIDRQREAGHPVSPAVSIATNLLREALNDGVDK